jgi:hypothetical protein
MTRTIAGVVFAVCAALLTAGAGPVLGDEIPRGWQAENMVPVGHLSLDGRYSYKMTVKQKDGRWYMYVPLAKGGEGLPDHAEPSTLVVIDVTDPRNPKKIREIEVSRTLDMGQVSLHGDLLITNLARPLTVYDTTHPINFTSDFQPDPPLATKNHDEGIVLWDVSAPANPKQISKFEVSGFGTHRNSYPGGKYAYLSASMAGYRGMSLVIVDVSDPAHPKFVSQWAQFGQRRGEEREDKLVPSFHGPASVSPDGKMLTMGYHPYVVNLDISDIAHPKLIGRTQVIPPFANNVTQSVHTVLPYWDRKLLYVSGEPKAANCKEPLPLQGMMDNSDPAHPELISIFPVPRPPKNSPWKDFCEKPGRFGPHNVSTEIHNPDVEKPGDLIHVAYFNAGLRVYDIHDARLPTETGWFLPPEPSEPRRSQSGMLTTSISQDTLTDTRHNVYLLESGELWILRDTGVNAPK